jgi:transposase
MGCIHGAHRHEEILFPERLDDSIVAENPVRFLDAFVDHLHLTMLGCQRATPAATGRPVSDPADLLKLYLYGSLYHLRSRRRLEQETHRHVEVMGLLKKLRPDHKTLADCRKHNLQPLRQVCRAFTVLCQQVDLCAGALVALDGSKCKPERRARQRGKGHGTEGCTNVQPAGDRKAKRLSANETTRGTVPASVRGRCRPKTSWVARAMPWRMWATTTARRSRPVWKPALPSP